MPGRVYRNEAISARAHCFFHQVEGLYIDRNVGFADLKQTLYFFVQEIFGKEVKVRFRPSYFSFTEKEKGTKAVNKGIIRIRVLINEQFLLQQSSRSSRHVEN